MTEETKPFELVKISGPAEAEKIKGILEKQGVECTLSGEGAANTPPATRRVDAVRIWVNPEDAERAREIVDAFFNPVEVNELIEPVDGLGEDADARKDQET